VKPIPALELAAIMEAAPVGLTAADLITGFATDSREVKPGDLFLAIAGARVDGHDFAARAIEMGATAVLAEREVPVPHLRVENLVEALAKMGRHFRSRFEGPVVGITGSAGKTSTKEFVAAALSPLGEVVKTPGNRNTEFTAPLLWAEVDAEVKAVVVEMSMRGFGQVAHLASFSQPTVGIVTNIGTAHIELVGSREGIARAKGELIEALPPSGLAVLNGDDDYNGFLAGLARCEVATFGTRSADARLVEYRAEDWTHSAARYEVDGRQVSARLPAVGRHMALNAASALLVASRLGIDLDSAARALETADLPPMRMQAIPWQGATIVMDAYNASPASMHVALETLGSVPCQGRRLAVLGEMKELGDFSEAEHRAVGERVARSGLDEVCFYGAPMGFAMAEAKARGFSSVRMADSLEDVAAFLRELQPGDTVLVKGSRGLELEGALALVGVNA